MSHNETQTGHYDTREELVEAVLNMSTQPNQYPNRRAIAEATGASKSTVGRIINTAKEKQIVAEIEVDITAKLNELWKPTEVPEEDYD